MTPCNGIRPTRGLTEPGCALPACPRAAVLCVQMLSISEVWRRRYVRVSGWALPVEVGPCSPRVPSPGCLSRGERQGAPCPCVCVLPAISCECLFTQHCQFMLASVCSIFSHYLVFSGSCWLSSVCGWSSPRCTALAHNCLRPLSRLVVDAPAFDMGLGDSRCCPQNVMGCSGMLSGPGVQEPRQLPCVHCTLCGHGVVVVPFLGHGKCVLAVRALPGRCLQTLS